MVEEIWLSLDQAVPCGLIVNELLANSLKDAFSHGQCGTVGLELHVGPPGKLTLKVWDNGVGFPPNDLGTAYASLGLELVHDLVRQLQGIAVTESNPSVRVTITFPQDLALVRLSAE